MLKNVEKCRRYCKFCEAVALQLARPLPKWQYKISTTTTTKNMTTLDFFLATIQDPKRSVGWSRFLVGHNEAQQAPLEIKGFRQKRWKDLLSKIKIFFRVVCEEFPPFFLTKGEIVICRGIS